MILPAANLYPNRLGGMFPLATNETPEESEMAKKKAEVVAATEKVRSLTEIQKDLATAEKEWQKAKDEVTAKENRLKELGAELGNALGGVLKLAGLSIVKDKGEAEEEAEKVDVEKWLKATLEDGPRSEKDLRNLFPGKRLRLPTYVKSGLIVEENGEYRLK